MEDRGDAALWFLTALIVFIVVQSLDLLVPGVAKIVTTPLDVLKGS